MDWSEEYWRLFLAHSKAWIMFTSYLFDTWDGDPYA
jgi:hypothetical protein